MEDWTTQLQADLAKLTETITIAPAKTAVLLPGERRDVAILFLDIKGFTALSETMDHEMVHKVIGGVMVALSRVVEGFGGYVDKYEGDLIMALFGAKVTSEHDCQRAVSCALQMQATIQDIGKILLSKGIELGARIGINYGTVTVGPDPSGHFTAMGDEVNLASRMESNAEVNTVLVTEQVYQICQLWFHWTDLGFITVKGKREPVHVYRPIQLIEPQKLTSASSIRQQSIPMFGRDGLLEESIQRLLHYPLTECTEQFSSAGCRILFFCGDAGIGKTRMLQEIFRGIPAGHFRIVTTTTRSFAQPPFWIWQDVLRQLFDFDGTEHGFLSAWECLGDHQAVLSSAKPFIATLLGLTDDTISSIDPAVRYQNTLYSLRDVMVAFADTQLPLLISIDDYQWIDSASREVFQVLRETFRSKQAMQFIVTTRNQSDSNDFSDKTDTSESQKLFHRIDLLPISEPESKQLAEFVLEQSTIEVPQNNRNRLLETITKKSQGNPYFVTELCYHLLSQETPPSKIQTTTSPEPHAIPATLSTLLRTRIDQMPAQERSCLQFCSVLGTEFSLSQFQTISDKLQVGFQGSLPLTKFVEAGFLQTCESNRLPGYRFTQILLHDAAYETCLLHNRAIIHRCAAENLEERHKTGDDESTLQIAHHWRCADDGEKTIEWGLQAIKIHAEFYQLDDALYWSEEVIKRLSTLEQSRRTDDLHYRALFPIFSLLLLHGKLDEYQNTIETMYELSVKNHWDDRRAASMCSLATLIERKGNHTHSISLLHEAIEISRKVHNSVIEVQALNDLGTVYLAQQQYSQAEQYFLQANTIARENQLNSQLATTLTNLGVIHRNRGNFEESLRCNREALSLALKLNNRKLKALLLLNLANVEYSLTHIEESYQLFMQALTILRDIGNKQQEAITLSNLGYLRFEQGGYDEAEALYLSSLRLTQEIHAPLNEANVLTNMGLLYRQIGQLEQAISVYGNVTQLIEKNQFLESAFSDYLLLRDELLEEGVAGERLPMPTNWL
ncbi:MAG: tetratricopeptide repeat protein [bacterium]|nr:tetratricopeptide repeat protein [bacterium]